MPDREMTPDELRATLLRYAKEKIALTLQVEKMRQAEVIASESALDKAAECYALQFNSAVAKIALFRLREKLLPPPAEQAASPSVRETLIARGLDPKDYENPNAQREIDRLTGKRMYREDAAPSEPAKEFSVSPSLYESCDACGGEGVVAINEDDLAPCPNGCAPAPTPDEGGPSR